MASGRKLIINWLIKSKAIKDDERELYEYALYSIVLLLSPAFISIAIGCIMGIPINGVLMVIPFLFLRKFSGGFHAKHACTCFVGSSILVTVFLWISTKINSGLLLYMVTAISVVGLCIFSPIQSDNRIIADIAGKEIVTICMFLGIIIMAVMQVPCLIGGGNWGIIVTCKQF